MNEKPIVFALANPNPEISYDKAMASRKDLIFATGRSDYPNQINNVLGFPYIFRGSPDIRATAINEEMKLAATYTIAKTQRTCTRCCQLGLWNKETFVRSRIYYPQSSRPQTIDRSRFANRQSSDGL